MKLSDLIPSTQDIQREAFDRSTVNIEAVTRAMLTAYREIVASGPSSSIDFDAVRPLLETLIQYVTGDPAFCDSPLVSNRADLRKGIWLKGDYGTGKTTAFNVFRRMNSFVHLPNPIKGRTVSCHQIHELARAGDGFMHVLEGASHIIIDDLGREQPVYGQYQAKALIETAYLRRIRLHASTNYTREQLSEKYGHGVGDRIAEMCNLIQMPNAETFRK